MQNEVKFYLLINEDDFFVCRKNNVKYYYDLLYKYYNLFSINWLILKLSENFIFFIFYVK